jgi:hypothetical protein
MVEESGVKWSIEHFHEGIVMSWGPQTLYHKTFILSKPHIPIADYTPKPSYCQTFIAKYFVGFCMVFAGFCRKKYIKVWKISRKPGKKVCLS